MSLISEFNKLVESNDLTSARRLADSAKKQAYPKSLLLYMEQVFELKDPYPLFKCKIEAYANNVISGWIFNGDELKKTASALLKINGEPYAIISSTQLRADVNKALGVEGKWGFSFKINSSFFPKNYIELELCSPYNCNQKGDFLVVEDDKPNRIISLQQLAMTLASDEDDVHLHFDQIQADLPLVETLIHKNTDTYEAPAVSIIMLNLNGENVLKYSIRSFLNAMSSEDELIIIDHGSDDGSIEVIESNNDHRIKLIKREKNYSFSQSNNYAASIAANNTLIFANNDLVLNNDNFNELIYPIFHNNEQIVGAALLDVPRDLPKVFDFKRLPSCIQHSGIRFKNDPDYTIAAEDIRLPSCFLNQPKFSYFRAPASTGALFAISKQYFNKLNGFDEGFYYGQEDVHLCLKSLFVNHQSIYVSIGFKAYHFHGFTRLDSTNKHSTKQATLINNRKHLSNLAGDKFIRLKKTLGLDGVTLLSGKKKINIAFVISELSLSTSAGDVFTAAELAGEFQESGIYNCFFVKSNSNADLSHIDIIINMLHNASLVKYKNLSLETIKICWMRNWFDKWSNHQEIDSYDLLFSSSQKACNLLGKLLRRNIIFMPIAASNEAVNYDPSKSNQCKSKTKVFTFIGSYFNAHRQISEWLNPKEINETFELYGHNWHNHPNFKNYTKGPISYKNVFDVYAKSSLILDDANHATRKWGSVNCRVFDALAMGIPVITNGELGNKDVFNDALPTYSDSKSLKNAIIKSLSQENNDPNISKLQKLVKSNHSYHTRHIELHKHINEFYKKPRVNICTAIPSMDSCAKQWGDLYLAREIRNALEKHSVTCSIGAIDTYKSYARISSLNLLMRGLHEFDESILSNSLLWIISHPKKVTISELIDPKYVLWSSKKFLELHSQLRHSLGTNSATYVPQFSSLDTEDFSSSEIDDLLSITDPMLADLIHGLEFSDKFDFLFIGNSRNVFRDVIKFAVNADLNFKVIGNGWEQFIDKSYILCENVPNAFISISYKKAKVVLCDHWKDMAQFGFISNRIYDLMKLGLCFVTDYVDGISEVSSLYPGCFVYKTEEEFNNVVQEALDFSDKNPSMVTQNENYQHFMQGCDGIVNATLEILREGSKS
ncbi:glycosyltransferase [Synechococcus sp. AH-601-B19]|nr:glycosyltransferase [Synechococcus sp. AH-601-B19]